MATGGEKLASTYVGILARPESAAQVNASVDCEQSLLFPPVTFRARFRARHTIVSALGTLSLEGKEGLLAV